MKRAIFVVVWLAALCLCLVGADKLTRRVESENKYDPFFEEEQPFDVLYFGTSHVLDGFSPMELWRDQGITAYNMGNSSECLESTEWTMRIAFEYKQPKIALIDVYYIDRAVTEAWTFAYRHLFFDAIPLSPLKVQAVCATLPESSWLEFLMPFSLYHGRWEELITGPSELTTDTPLCMMGAELRIARAQVNPFTRTTEMNTEELPGTQALHRIVALCRERGIEPIFTAIPAPVTQEEQRNMNGVQQIADELGVTFLNLFDVEGLVDYDTDCYDAVGHLNPDGASKVTAYLGSWLSEHTELTDKRGQTQYAHWDERLSAYEILYAERWGDKTLLGTQAADKAE